MTAIMGCFPSNAGKSNRIHKEVKEYNNKKSAMSMNEETVVQAYVRLDNTIIDIEKHSPAPQLASILPLLQISQEELMKYEQDLILSSNNEKNDTSITQTIVDLQLFQNPHLASEHEEFIANLNRKAINKLIKGLVEKRFEELKKTKIKLENDVEELQMLYKEQDILLEKVLGNQYGSVEERTLESALSRSRALRDTLSVGARAWNIAADAAIKANHLATSALSTWQLTSQTKNMIEKVQLGVEARDALVAAAQEVIAAQNTIPDAHFPYCTSRQLQALSLTLDYMFTDMYSNDRYSHTTRVFSGFVERTLSLATWISNTLKTSLDKDLFEVEKDLDDINTQLRTIRVNLIVEKGFAEVRYRKPREAIEG